jgi:hypothetical protein
MEQAVYVLCAATALACSFLLFRSYRRRRVALLLWCGLAFSIFTLENVILFVDVILVPDIDLSLVRRLVAFLGVAVLLFGLIWETK